MQLLLYRDESFNPNFYYHAGVDLDHCFLLCSRGGKTLFTPKLNESLARASFRGRVVVFKDPLEALSKYIKGRAVLVDEYEMTAGMAKRLRKLCRLKDASAELLRERMVKKPSEVRRIRKAVKHTKEILASLDFKAAKTELDLKKQILVAIAEKGLEPAFDPIVSADKNTSYPHYTSGKKKLGSLVLVDCGVRYEHYCSDLTRCFILDNSRKKKAQYEDLQEICHEIVDGLPSLRTGRKVAAFADRLMKKAGFPRLIHSIGHGIGLDVHELPELKQKSGDGIAGSVMAIEPAFYLKSYGMRYEEVIHFDGRKPHIL